MSTVAFVSPFAITSATLSRLVNASISAGGSVEVAITSRSRNVSRRRRAEPASDTFTAAGCARSSSTSSSRTGSPSPSRRLDSRGSFGSSASALRIFSSLFAPSPGEHAQPLLLRRLLQLRRWS